jgi:hypothetical protein
LTGCHEISNATLPEAFPYFVHDCQLIIDY